MHPFYFSRAWSAIALFGIAAIFILSLAPMPSLGPDLPHGDKYGHALAYFVQMLWMAALFQSQRWKVSSAFSLVAAGGLIEILQSTTTYRQGDYFDWLADSIGIALAYALASWRREISLLPLDHWLHRHRQK